jgi:digeranylgeranylglycerophospholipid reductase
MNVEHWDILVVGAGPAGSSAALSAVRQGARVLVVERRRVVGIPVRCAEYIPAPLLRDAPGDRSFVVQAIQGMRTIIPGGEVTETRAPGFMIRRDRFDQALAGEAGKMGAEIRLSTRALFMHNGRTILKGHDGRSYAVEAKVVIGADGPHSTVGRWIGTVNQNMIPALQVKVSLARAMDYTEVYFNHDIYGGYGWLFPKRNGANVGVGMRRRGRFESIKQVLDRFLSVLNRAGKIEGEPFGMTAGWIPVSPLKKSVQGNILLVGDAAGQTHPITGAGVTQAMICGRKGGKWAARAVETGDIHTLSGYEKDWREHFGDTLERASIRRRTLEREWGRLESIIKSCWVAYKEYYAAP